MSKYEGGYSDYCGLFDRSVTYLRRLKRLKVLRLVGNGMEEGIVIKLLGCIPYLSILVISRNELKQQAGITPKYWESRRAKQPEDGSGTDTNQSKNDRCEHVERILLRLGLVVDGRGEVKCDSCCEVMMVGCVYEYEGGWGRKLVF